MRELIPKLTVVTGFGNCRDSKIVLFYRMCRISTQERAKCMSRHAIHTFACRVADAIHNSPCFKTMFRMKTCLKNTFIGLFILYRYADFTYQRFNVMVYGKYEDLNK